MQTHPKLSQSTRSPVQNALIILANLFALFLLLATCIGTPFLVGHFVNPWCGLASCVPSFWLWRRFGPPPGPTMLAGFLCIQGCFAIVGTGIALLLLGFMKLFE
jgi:hypothetical protein